MMKWRTPSDELIALFEEVTPGPPAIQRKMFGFPAAFVNGNMFMGLHQEDMVLRLSDVSRAELMTMDGARIFEPMPGRPMREYVVVPPALIRDRAKLASWAKKALDYALSLPPKAKQSTTKKSGAGRKVGSRKSR